MKLRILILLIFISLSISIYSDVDKKDICGFWGDAFPIPSAVYGYIFLEDNSYVFFDFREYENVKSKYYGTWGKWKIEKNRLYINKICHLLWKDELELIGSAYVSGEGNKLIPEYDKNLKWQYIADLKTIIKKEKEPDELNIHYILNKKLSKSAKKYYFLYPMKYFHYAEWLEGVISTFDECKLLYNNK